MSIYNTKFMHNKRYLISRKELLAYLVVRKRQKKNHFLRKKKYFVQKSIPLELFLYKTSEIYSYFLYNTLWNLAKNSLKIPSSRIFMLQKETLWKWVKRLDACSGFYIARKEHKRNVRTFFLNSDSVKNQNQKSKL